MKRFRETFLIVLPLIFGLTPVIWFWDKWDQVINGIDTNFPLDPLMWFQQRFFVWGEVFNGGRDVASSTAGLFFHGLQVLFYALTADLTQTQLATLIFWFLFLGFSITFFLRTILGKINTFALLTGVSFYLFNTYLFNTWENVKVANLALVGGLPLVVAFFWKGINDRSISWSALSWTIVVSFFIAGSGINPAYFAVLLGVPFLLFLILLIWRLFHDKKLIFHSLVFSFLFFGSLVLVNSFWIWPTSFFLVGFGQTLTTLEGIGFVDWVSALSQNTSILNIMKLQGAWDWYSTDGQGLPLYIPYAPFYLSNRLSIIFAMLLPLLALIGLYFGRKKNEIMAFLFASVFVFGVFLSAGIHPPTGDAFIWLSEHIPFLSFFRSPWYIFTPIILLSMAALITIFYQEILVFLEKRTKKALANITVGILAATFIVVNLFYNWPLVTGAIFRPGTNQNFLIKVPDYVFESKAWVEKRNTTGRILDYPARETENFTWGYRGIESVLKLITNKPVIYFKDFSPGVLLTGNIIRGKLYQFLNNGQVSEALKVARVFSVDTILEKRDLFPVTKWEKDFPLLDQPVFEKKIQFGLWSFFVIPDRLITPRVFVSGLINKIWGSQIAIVDALLIEEDQRGVFVNGEDFPNQPLDVPDRLIISPRNNYLENFNTFIEIVHSIKEEEQQRRERYFNQPPFPATEVLYEFEAERSGRFIPKLEREHLVNYGFEEEGEWEVLLDGQLVKLTVDRAEDRWLFFQGIELSGGKHQLKLPLPKNPNLIDNGSFEQLITLGEYAQNVADSVDGQFSVELRARENDREMTIPVNQFDPQSFYLISTNYKHMFGYRPTFKLFQKVGREVIYQHTEHMAFSRNWQPFRGIFRPNKVPSTLDIHLIAFANVEEGTAARWDDLKITRIFTNSLFLQEVSSTPALATPEITFNKQNQTRWIVKVKNASKPYVLNFLENYSRGWKVYPTNDPESILGNLILKLVPEDKHLIVQGYANGWVIDKTGNYYLIIEYLPQRVFYLVFLVSFVIIFSSVIVLLLPAIKIIWRRYAGG